MANWSLFKKSKPENKYTTIDEKKEIIINKKEYEIDYKPFAEYKETLYTGKKSSKKTKNTSSSNEQRYWSGVDLIEKKVNKLHITHAQKPTTEVDKTIDKLIQKRKKK